jgi:hypothetical protein
MDSTEDPHGNRTAGSPALDALVAKLLEQGRMRVETWLHLMRRVGRKRNTFYLLDALDAFRTHASARTAAAPEELGVAQLCSALVVAAAAMHGSDPDHAVERLVAEVEEVLAGVGGAGSASVYEQAYEGMCGGGAVLGVIREHEGVVRHIYSTYCAEDRFLAADEITWEEVCRTNMTMPFKDLASAARAHALVPDLLGVNEMELLFAEVTGVAPEAVKDEGGANVSASFPEFLDLLWRFALLIPVADDVDAEIGGSGSGSPDQLRRRTNTSSVMNRLTPSGNQSNHSTSDAPGALDRWRMESLLDRMGLVVEGGRGGASSAVPIRPPVLGGGQAAGSGAGAMSAMSSTAAMPLSERQAAELATAAAMRLERFLGELDVEVDSVTPSMLRLPPPPRKGLRGQHLRLDRLGRQVPQAWLAAPAAVSVVAKCTSPRLPTVPWPPATCRPSLLRQAQCYEPMRRTTRDPPPVRACRRSRCSVGACGKAGCQGRGRRSRGWVTTDWAYRRD